MDGVVHEIYIHKYKILDCNKDFKYIYVIPFLICFVKKNQDHDSEPG